MSHWNILKLEPEPDLFGIEKNGIIIARFPAICLPHVKKLVDAANRANKKAYARGEVEHG